MNAGFVYCATVLGDRENNAGWNSSYFSSCRSRSHRFSNYFSVKEDRTLSTTDTAWSVASAVTLNMEDGIACLEVKSHNHAAMTP